MQRVGNADDMQDQSERTLSGRVAGAREVSLDVARVIAMCCVVLEHACVATMLFPMQRLLWPVQDRPPEQPGAIGGLGSDGLYWVDALFHIVRGLGVPLVTVAAGFVAMRALERKGAHAFLAERRRRLGGALLLGVALVLPAMYVVWAWGWTQRGWASWANVADVRFGPAVQPNLYGLGHLWYLEYLLIYSLIAAAWWTYGVRRKSRAAGESGVSQFAARVAVMPVARVAIALGVLAPALTLWPSSVVSFHNGFIPEPGQFIKYFLFFAWGMALARTVEGRKHGVRAATKWWVADLLLAGVGAWILLVGMIHLHDNVWPEEPRWPRLPFAPDVKGFEWQRFETMVGASLLSVCGCFGLLGLSERVAARAGRFVRWFAESTMVVYLLHLIPIGVCCVLWYKVDVPVVVKIGSGFVVGMGLPLLGRWVVKLILKKRREKKA